MISAPVTSINVRVLILRLVFGFVFIQVPRRKKVQHKQTSCLAISLFTFYRHKLTLL